MSERALYAITAAVYIASGVAVPELLFSWIEGAAALLLGICVLPAVFRRLR